MEISWEISPIYIDEYPIFPGGFQISQPSLHPVVLALGFKGPPRTATLALGLNWHHTWQANANMVNHQKTPY
jgi:hypothetical protein